MKKRRIGFTAKSILLICALLLLTNVVLGSILLRRSQRVMKSLINDRMLDIANTAAATVDGDALKTLTAEDKGTPEYQKIYDSLRLFQDNIALEFIYTIRDMGNGAFIFIIDPAEENASEFGELVTVTAALKKASLGTPSVDAEPYKDQWGRFYSAYSPVYDSAGRIVGLVCVDFRADWYDEQTSQYGRTVMLFSLISLFIGACAAIAITAKTHSRLRALSEDLTELTGNVDALMAELSLDTEAEAYDPAAEEKHSSDELGELGKRIRSIRDSLRRYIDHAHAQANGMITAMASDYRSVYYIDLDTDEGICYRAHSKIDNGLREGEHFSFREVFTDYANHYVAESYREEFLRFISPDAIRQELEKESIVAHRYLVIRDGHESYEMLRMAGVRHPEDRTDHMVHAVGVGFTDVDKETRESLAQRQALRDALVLAENANRAKTAFLSSMSHEIRTPMNAIIGLDSIALNDPDISAKTRECLEKIGNSAQHLLGLINDILDMSRIESGRMVIRNEEFSFLKLLEQINAMIDGQCRGKGLTYQCCVAEQLDNSWFVGDDMKLKQVLINILGNAVKFTPEGGEVDLTVERTAHYEGKTTLRFTIRDTGIGMDKSFLSKLFDPFSQEDSSTTSKYGSTGLGMAITKNIVEMMNGKIDVESEKGVGTTFTVSVTLMDSDRAGEAPGDGEISFHGLSVLVVDDYPVSCEQAKLLLEQIGVTVETAHSGAEAVELVRLRHARRESYDLLLIDWKMPEMDGIETSRRIRSVLADESAIIILTAYNWSDIADEAAEAGVNGFIAKPLSTEAFLSEFSRAIKKERERAQPRKAAALEGRRVLLAEDMDINAEILEDILGMRGIVAERAVNGRAAVEMFSSHPEGWYDAVLMDMRMPEMDGLEASAAIRAMERADAKSTPIIALTANAFDEDVQRSLQAGLNAHLSKPVEPENLFRTLEELL